MGLKNKFIVYLHQPGGCDYTIDCGSKLIELNAKTIDKAKKEVSKLIKEDYSHIDLDEVVLYSAEKIDFDLDAVYTELEEEKAEFEKVEQDEKDRKEYERLKKKFG